MKTQNYLLLFIAIAFLLSCDKNKNNDSGPTSDNQRIKQVIFDYEGDEDDWRSDFTYEGEDLIMINEYVKDEQGTWIDDYQAEIKYNGTIITMTWYYNESGNWETESRNEYTIENGRIKEELNFDFIQNQWIVDWKWTYQYSGSNLLAWHSYENNESGTLEQDEKGEFVYDNNMLVEYKGFEKDESDNWVQDDRETFSYSGTDLMGWVDFDLDEAENWIESYKCDYSYSGEYISTAMYYDWDDGINNWETDPYSEFFSYNSNGYLIGRNDSDGDRVSYVYEEGKGNAKLLWYYPEDMVYGEPTFKAATVRNKCIPYYKRISPKIQHLR